MGENTNSIKCNIFLGANYFVSAMPFLSAAQQGLMGPEIQVIVNNMNE